MNNSEPQNNRKSVCLITSGYVEKNLRLQPWRYLSEVALQLTQQGHAVTVITDGGDTQAKNGKEKNSTGENSTGDNSASEKGGAPEQVAGVTIRRIPSVNRYAWQRNAALQSAVEASKPAVILWHLGLPSFMHQHIHDWPDVPVLGIFPGLVYRPAELLRLGLKRIAKGYKLSAIHVAGMLVPKQFVRRAVADRRLAGLVVQTQSTSQRLLDCGLQPEQVKVILPGVDAIWARTNGNAAREREQATRQSLGYTPAEKVVLYFGSPAPLRGLLTLIRALELARKTDPSLKLLVLNRRRRDELLQEDAELRHLLENRNIGPHVEVISGFLQPDELLQHVAATDIVALPFELVPADAPLSILEAKALGKPIVTTRVASLPEMVAGGESYLAEPADPVSLAQALLKAAHNLDRKRHADPDELPDELPDAPPRTFRSWHKVGEEWSALLQTL